METKERDPIENLSGTAAALKIRSIAKAARICLATSQPAGNALNGTAPMKGFSTASPGRGLRANVQHNTSPRNCPGADAAIEIAIGPENDSPSRI